MNPWPHQDYAVREVLAAIERGERRVCLTSPTGGGKTVTVCRLIDHWTERRLNVAVYSNRRMLIEQTSRVLHQQGIGHGVRASGWSEEATGGQVRICSIQTEGTRTRRRQDWKLFDADVAVVDEAHTATTGAARRILEHHHAEGAAYVGVTATPIDLGGLYDTIIQAGTTSELRECGALVPAVHYGPDEPDLKSFRDAKASAEGEDLSENQQRSVMGGLDENGSPSDRLCRLFGRVIEWFDRLNPDRRPTILFAPGVRESLWFAEQFSAAGIPAAHIDGSEVWVDGHSSRSNRDLRGSVLDRSRRGDVVLLCNRFVLREGVDAPWLAHGIFATVFGSLQSYLQAGGRLLRAYPGLEHITIQDHGGNWWRHGSLNEDREWSLDMTNARLYARRAEVLRANQKQQPYLCPRCRMAIRAGKCRLCGWAPQKGLVSRQVVMEDGTLRELPGHVFRKRRVNRQADGPALWERMYYRARSEKWDATFMQAMACFAMENGWTYPDPSWPFMPRNPEDLASRVRQVGRDDLIPKEVTSGHKD